MATKKELFLRCSTKKMKNMLVLDIAEGIRSANLELFLPQAFELSPVLASCPDVSSSSSLISEGYERKVSTLIT
jgi:hypothetical protein